MPGTAEAGFTDQPEAVHQRLRGGNADLDRVTSRVIPLPPPMTPRRVPRPLPPRGALPHQLLATRAAADRLNHPILFDHPVDHAPGMLLEAVRQAAYGLRLPPPGVLTDMEMRFFRYAGLNSPCWIETTALPDLTASPDRRRLPVRVVARQNGEDVFTATATITATAAAPLHTSVAP
ncbi:AfsA-related hotdog domain-containing protein [Streptomyces virginiae]|uniref:AfsA-related hotdog domain-containing protein n=1 Tax=Streptomyces virginiae TaxID=1961 RepID=UPI000690723C|nr:AfsA-related hotdog domain-containing protein [Streptomyces virginiae]